MNTTTPRTTLRRALRATVRIVLAALVLFAVAAALTWWFYHPHIQRTDGVVYGQRGAHPLSLDVLRPDKPNGVGILVLVSGRWKSGAPGSFQEWIVAPLLRRGYTVFAVYHVSQPEASVMEIIEDMHRAVRFVRHHAPDYAINPNRLGVTGGSAGGHLALMLATRGGPGPTDAPDPVERESSAVQAVAIFFPVTNLLDLGKSTENLGDGGPPRSFRNAFGPDATNLTVWRKVGGDSSPIFHITTNLPPILICHGDADTLVPLEQSQWFVDKAKESGKTVRLVIHRGGQHGWWSMPFDVFKFADWFDAHLQR